MPVGRPQGGTGSQLTHRQDGMENRGNSFSAILGPRSFGPTTTRSSLL
jgi:hypothetical protein